MLPRIPLGLAGALAAAATGATAQEEGGGNFTVGQAVETSSGSFRGHAAAEGSDVSAYLGIPYARPPVGDLRFAPPQAVDAAAAAAAAAAADPPAVVVDAAAFGPSCPGAQLYPVSPRATGLTAQGREILDEWDQVGDRFDEDCLTLNVWTKPQAGDARKAVLVWVYGGGFFTGGSSVPLYNGRVFADEQDVVVVTFNYRLNMFGFPGSPATQLNVGLLDMRMAIEWVSQNIAQFGGDPDRIVLFGQAAGAMAVDILLYAFPDDPIVKGAILQSGNAATFEKFGPPTAAGAATLWSRTADGLGCSGSGADDDDAAVLACMRGLPAEALLRAQFPSSSRNPAPPGRAQAAARGGFLPAVDNATVFGDYAARGAPARVPVLVGTNDNEGGLALALGLANAGVNITIVGDGAAAATDRADATYGCPAARRADRARAAGAPAWRYRYFGAFPNARLLAGVETGAWHGAELGVLFGTGQAVEPNTPGQDALGALMRGLWAAFARDPAAGLDGFMGGVSRYAPGNESLIRLGYENSADLSFAGGDSYDGDCARLAPASAQGGGGDAQGQSNGAVHASFGHEAPRVNAWLLGLLLLLTAAVSSAI